MLGFEQLILGVFGATTLVGLAACSTTGPKSAATHVVVHVNPSYDLQHPARIGSDYYPPESIRLHEEGEAIVKVTIAADGAVEDVELQVSTGYPRLDAATLAGLKPGTWHPATDDGKPVRGTAPLRVKWKIAQPPTG